MMALINNVWQKKKKKAIKSWIIIIVYFQGLYIIV